jgi:hypothetical protein
MTGWLSNLIAVLGTLAAGLGTGTLQARTARRERLETRRDGRRVEALDAVTQLVAALADHRRAMWVLEDRRLSGAGDPAVTEATAASHDTRSVVTAPLAMVSILVPSLAEPARQATRATYAMRNAKNHDALEALRKQALCTSDHLVASAAEFFEDMQVMR